MGHVPTFPQTAAIVGQQTTVNIPLLCPSTIVTLRPIIVPDVFIVQEDSNITW